MVGDVEVIDLDGFAIRAVGHHVGLEHCRFGNHHWQDRSCQGQDGGG